MPIQIKIIHPKRYCPACGGLAQHRELTSIEKFSNLLLDEILPFHYIIMAMMIIFMGMTIIYSISFLGIPLGITVGFSIFLIFMYKVSNLSEAIQSCECSKCGLQLPRCKFLKNHENHRRKL